MKKKLWTSIIMAAMMTASISGCGNGQTSLLLASSAQESTAGQNSDKSATAKQSSEEDEGGLSDNLSDCQVEINGSLYQFPMKYSEFTKLGWKYSGDGEDPILPNEHAVSDWFADGEDRTVGYLTNYDVNNVLVSDSYLSGLVLDLDYMTGEETSVLTAKGITLGVSTQEDVEAAYGEPERVTKSDSFPTVTYVLGPNSSVEFGFDMEQKGVLSEIDIQNYSRPAGFEVSEETSDKSNGETNETESGILAYIAGYEAPEELSQNLFDYTISYAGDLYQLPAPVSAFQENGWEIVESESQMMVAGEGKGKITLMRDGQTLWTYATNYAAEDLSIVNCMVTNLAANVNDCNVDMKLAEDIAMGMPQETLGKIVIRHLYRKNEGSYTYYWICEKTKDSNGYEFIVKDGKVTGIEAIFVPEKLEDKK